jgi:hypothetical protein
MLAEYKKLTTKDYEMEFKKFLDEGNNIIADA